MKPSNSLCQTAGARHRRGQKARSWGLQATMSLARLQQRQGKRQEARQMLSAIYGWFTEGFDTPDLQQARALEHLSGDQVDELRNVDPYCMRGGAFRNIDFASHAAGP